MGSGITSGECSAYYNITEETVSEWLFTPEDIIIITIIIPIILVLGVINNFTFLFVIFRIPKMKSTTNIYFAHLAMADLVYLTMNTVYNISRYTASPVAHNAPFMNSASCVGFIIVFDTAYFASIALVTMMSFERYIALCHPMKHLRIRGRRRTYRMVAICWLLGLVFAGSTVPGGANLYVQCLQWPDSDMYEDFPSTAAYCDSVHPWVTYYAEPLVNVPWLIAMVANVYMYIGIIQVLNKRRGADGRVETDQKALQIRNQVAKMLIVNGVVFFLCQTPYRVMNLARWICFLAQIPNPIYAALGRNQVWIATIPQLINSIVNPLIYGVMNSQYRAALIQAFHCKAQPPQPKHQGAMNPVNANCVSAVTATPKTSDATSVTTYTNASYANTETDENTKL